MSFGFRYHVASLLAVFFSLVLGILIGGALFPDHILVDEQALIITELEERFRQMQVNLSSAEDELNAANLAWGQLVETVSEDMLAAKTVIVVDLGLGILSPLRTILESAGAEVVEVKASHVGELKPSEDSVFVLPLSCDSVTPELEMVLSQLAFAGSHLAFVWDMASEPYLEDLPPGLKVDSIDTAMGKLALLLGIARGSEGHYGRQKGAQGLFP
jgi:hypothetical protein